MRIVSLLPSATEILFALGAADQVVGVTHECDFPPEAQSKPQLTASSLPHAGSAAEIDRHVRASIHAGSSLYSLDAAKLDALQPDLIITQELCVVCAVSYAIVTEAVRRSSADPRVVSLEPSSLEDVYGTITAVGDLIGSRANADQLLERLRARITKLQAHVAELRHGELVAPPPRTLVLEWTDPPMSGGHWTPGLVEIAGGTPILANPGANSRVIAWAEIAAADPDRVIVAPCGFGMQATLRAIAEITDPAWHNLRALREGNVVAIDGNAYVNRPGPRLIDTAELFAVAIHPALRSVYNFTQEMYRVVTLSS